ncbi:hypothetical protein [Microbacterium oleivorans]|uniref:Uncharacterized protein n=1 Tax=Microbacterium oleivorans TaxID=273677 RepID=A0A7D5EU34_9MICO|nr:hypothetical protein [Microbacterium oleivorans]QLD10752.1 hypothetical protein HW566_02525 [Microbacterium oleivorans]
MLRLVMFVGAGIAVGGVVVVIVGPPGAGAWAIPVGVTLVLVAGAFALVARSTRGMAAPTEAQLVTARAEGREGVARIDALTQTGTQINDQPVCEIEVTVQPRVGAAFRARTRRIVTLIEIPRFQPGTRHAVVTTPAGAVAFIGGDVGSAATSLPESGTAPLLLPAAGEGFGPRPVLGIGRRGRAARIVLFAAAAVVAAVTVVLPYRAAVAETVTALSAGRLHADQRQPGALENALQSLSGEIGHGTVSRVVVADDYVIAYAPVRPGETATDTWIYRRGEVTRQGPASIQPETVGEQFGIADVAWSKLWPLVESAARSEGVDDVSETSFVVDRGADSDIDSPTFAQPVGPVEVDFSVGDEYRDAGYRASADGSGLQRLR